MRSPALFIWRGIGTVICAASRAETDGQGKSAGLYAKGNARFVWHPRRGDLDSGQQFKSDRPFFKKMPLGEIVEGHFCVRQPSDRVAFACLGHAETNSVLNETRHLLVRPLARPGR
jgi:hypothetical protein